MNTSRSALQALTRKTLEDENRRYCVFQRLRSLIPGIVIQDGSSFAVKDCLGDVFPGRFKRVSPAAVELHVSMDLLNEALEHVTLTPDTFGERAELPEPQGLSGCLLLADRGYFSLSYVGEMIKAGASFVLRTKTNIQLVYPKELFGNLAQPRCVRSARTDLNRGCW